MKITLVNYVDGRALFVVDGFPDMTFCVGLKGKISQKEVTDELLSMLPVVDDTKKVFDDLELKSLEGGSL